MIEKYQEVKKEPGVNKEDIKKGTPLKRSLIK